MKEIIEIDGVKYQRIETKKRRLYRNKRDYVWMLQ